MSAELLSPAGDFATALAAFDAGADAVYLGLTDFSARAFATNFSLADLKNLMRVARARGKKVYVTFNTLIDEADVSRRSTTCAPTRSSSRTSAWRGSAARISPA